MKANLRRSSVPRLGWISIVVLAAAAGAASAQTPDPVRYLADIKTLAAPNMEGRGAGTKGIDRAARLIEKRYQSLKLQPAGSEGYLQHFSLVTGARLQRHNLLAIENSGVRTDAKINRDFVPFSFSSSARISAPVVFVGYGASADEFHYDDYAGLDVKDKIVLLLRDEPPSFGEKAGQHGFTQHSQLITKVINARNHGAKGVILINGKLADGEQDLLTRFGSVSGPENIGLPCVQVMNALADSWLQSSGKSVKQIQEQINSASAPQSFMLPDSLRLSLRVDIATTHSTVANLLAYLPGQTDEYVIVGAHYDHLGRGNFDSLAPSQIGQIHPGADDNASGTAGVLELARLLSSQTVHPKRGILFMNFAGEELGLLGSAYWVGHPTRPLDKAVAMINMDMIGRIKDEKIYIGGVGTGSTFKPVLEESARKEPSLKIEYSQGGYASSDHTSFVSKKIPVLFFFSGLHADYHKPSDTWEKINAKSAAELLDMVGSVATELADAPLPPAFQVVAEDKPTGTSGGSGYGAYFGSIPDFGQTDDGVKFSDVKPNSPAAKAGLKPGDVLVQFGDKAIHNLYDFTDVLRRGKIGEVVEVRVLRDGKPVTTSVKLEQRK